MMVVAAVATELRPYDPAVSYGGLDPFLFAIDGILLASFAAIAWKADRFWPMWLTALQLDAVAVHVIRRIDPEVVPYVYAWVTGQIAYPMMALLAAGTVRHQRRLLTLGVDRPWSRHEQGTPERLATGPGQRA